jgi:hypothetical protein
MSSWASISGSNSRPQSSLHTARPPGSKRLPTPRSSSQTLSHGLDTDCLGETRLPHGSHSLGGCPRAAARLPSLRAARAVSNRSAARTLPARPGATRLAPRARAMPAARQHVGAVPSRLRRSNRRRRVTRAVAGKLRRRAALSVRVTAAQQGAQKCASCASRRAIRAPDRYDARAHCNGCAKRMVKAPRGAGVPSLFRDCC